MIQIFRATLAVTAATLVAVAPSVALASPTVRLFANLTGGAEAPGPGKSNASGSAIIRLNRSARHVCYSITVRGLPGGTMAHIHRGGAGVAGPPLVALRKAAPRAFRGCTGVSQALFQDLINSPQGFYVNVHSKAFPNGAVRGQLHR